MSDDRAEAERLTWQFRAVEATRGNASLLGCILLAVIGRNAKNPPWIESPFTITRDGVCLADFVGRDRWETKLAPLCVVESLVGNFRGLADHLNFTDDERKELFDQLRKFIILDLRAEHDELRPHA